MCVLCTLYSVLRAASHISPYSPNPLFPKVKIYPKLGQIEALPLVDAETPVETVMASYTDRLTHDAHLDVTAYLGVTDAHTGVTGAGADVGMDAVDAGTDIVYVYSIV
jgi:hypothetical protein